MRKALYAILIMAAGLSLIGCGPTLYNINVNGYTDPAAPALIAPGDNFFVIQNQQAKNPLLEKEITEKINKLLTNKGFSLSAYEQARYYLFFSYGIGQEPAASVAMPDSNISYGFGIGSGYGSGWRHGGWGSGGWGGAGFGFYPRPDQLYDRWLLLNVVDGKYYREKGGFRTVWVGEARSTGTSQDLRVAINYLLVADFQQFGQNTGKVVPVEINEQAPQVQGLTK